MLLCVSIMSIASPATASEPSAGEITFILDKENLPYSSQRDNPPGLDAELARALAAEMGARASINWVDSLEEGLLSGLLPSRTGESSDIAVGVAVETGTVEGESGKVGEFVLFSRPYALWRYVLVSARDKPDLSSFARVKQSDVGVETGSVAYFELWNNGYLLRKFGAQRRVLNALAEGGLEYGILWPNCGWEIARDEKLNEALKIHPAEPGLARMAWPIGVAVSPGRPDLLESVNAALGRLLERGVIQDLYSKYHIPYIEPPTSEDK